MWFPNLSAPYGKESLSLLRKTGWDIYSGVTTHKEMYTPAYGMMQCSWFLFVRFGCYGTYTTLIKLFDGRCPLWVCVLHVHVKNA